MKLAPLLAALLSLGCGEVILPPGPPPPGPPPDPAPPGSCQLACDKLAELDCPAYTDDCVSACKNIEDRHRKGESELTLNPDCIATIEKCDEADTVCRE